MSGHSLIEYTRREPEDWEPERYYTDRGFHLVRPGEVYHDGQYKMIRKLAWGGSGTVWLAEQTKQVPFVLFSNNVCRTGRAVAAKMLSSKSRSPEAEMMLNIQAKERQCGQIVTLLDHFTTTGPNGTHECLIFELMWVDLERFLTAYQGDEDFEVREKVGREVAKQLLTCLEWCRVNGILHNGKGRRR
jgi:serine/threonine protein kinase